MLANIQLRCIYHKLLLISGPIWWSNLKFELRFLLAPYIISIIVLSLHMRMHCKFWHIVIHLGYMWSLSMSTLQCITAKMTSAQSVYLSVSTKCLFLMTYGFIARQQSQFHHRHKM